MVEAEETGRGGGGEARAEEHAKEFRHDHNDTSAPYGAEYLSAAADFARKHPAWQHSVSHFRRRPTKLLVIIALVFIILTQLHFNDHGVAPLATTTTTTTTTIPPMVLPTNWQQVDIHGFTNALSSRDEGCHSLISNATIAMLPSFHVPDDIQAIAQALNQHPMINYEGQNALLSHEAIVDKTWDRMAGASVWLEDYHVYLMVTRVYFYKHGVKRWPVISFIRGQIFDAAWNELKDYHLNWQGKILVFPLVFDIKAPFLEKGGFYGPEDPRILIEHGVSGAEPVIIFNMIVDTETVRRGMVLFRPFSNHMRAFEIEGVEPAQSEKNWAPFFHQSEVTQTLPRQPSTILHLVYKLEPLRVLRCHLDSGLCKIVFDQDIEHDDRIEHGLRTKTGSMRGGTNLELISTPTAHDDAATIFTYLTLPRTNTAPGCLDPDTHMYRPEIVLLSGNSTHFWFSYASGPLELMQVDAATDPCGRGQIIIANSIARIEPASRKKQSEITISMSRADETVEIIKMRGVLELADKTLALLESRVSRLANDPAGVLISGRDVGMCSVASASDYAVRVAAPLQGRPLYMD